MKTCLYCGGQYSDDTAMCPIDRTPLSLPPEATAPASSAMPAARAAAFEFAPLSAEQSEHDWATILTCPTIVSADLVASRLRAAGIETFIPDEFLLQTVAFNVNTFGYVRVQVAPKDYDAAKALLSEGAPDNS